MRLGARRDAYASQELAVPDYPGDDLTTGSRSSLRDHVSARPPWAVISSLALMLSAIASGVLSFVQWKMTVRSHPVTAMGSDVAEISTVARLVERRRRYVRIGAQRVGGAAVGLAEVGPGDATRSPASRFSNLRRTVLVRSSRALVDDLTTGSRLVASRRRHLSARPRWAVISSLALMLSAIASGVLSFVQWKMTVRSQPVTAVGSELAEIPTVARLVERQRGDVGISAPGAGGVAVGLVEVGRGDATRALGSRFSNLRRTVLVRPSRAVISSLALMLSAIGSGVLTFAFWTVMARSQGAHAVGSASGEISTVTFLAGVGSLNLINVFARFLPDAGERSRRFILTSYAAAATAGLIIAAIFLATSWSHSLVVGGTGGRIGFAVLVVVVSVFMIQDGGLIGLGRAVWVPVENITVGVVRLASLPIALLLLSDAVGAIWAWALATVVAVGVVNTLIVGRLAGARVGEPVHLPPRARLLRFIAIESVTTAAGSSLSAFLPAIVERVRGATEAGYFYLPWLITTTVSLLLMNVFISMVRELAVSRRRDPHVVLGQLRLCAIVLAGVLLVCCVDPSLVMDILGARFGQQGGGLLRWVGLSAPATAIGLLFWSFCLLDQNAWPIFGMNVANAILVIGGVILLGRTSSIASIGELYCGVQWVIAAAVAYPLLRRLRRSLVKDNV